MIKKILILILIIIACSHTARSQIYRPVNVATLSDSAQISILTSAPWNKEVYAVFGHSAIRIKDVGQNQEYIDIVYNYGIFDFKKPNFAYRFMAGETDYLVAGIYYDYYITEYEERGENVYEQVLNLNKDEKQKIWAYLINNAQPQNRVYRYNIFFNNCTTKLIDILEQSIDSKIVFPTDTNPKTFRELVHEHVNKQPWTQFGIDLIIGSKADRKTTIREKMFLPVYAMNILDKSYIQLQDGTQKPLVLSNTIIVKENPENNISQNNFFKSPLFAGIIILILASLASFYSYKQRRIIVTIFDFLLFLSAGIAGCIIFFMITISVHPCTSPNWNIVWLNPLLLVAAFLFFVKSHLKCIYYYHFINFAVLILFLLAWCLIPQQLEIAFIPFILAICLRSGMTVLRQKKLKQIAADKFAK